MLSKNMFFLITFYLMISSTLQGDLLKCLKDCATIVGDAALLVKDINEKKGISQIAEDIIQITKTIKFLIDDCENPVCLNKANDRCNADNKDRGCEQWGAMMYPKCQNDYHNVGPCLCSHDCPAGYRDDGLYCAKPQPYGRGTG